MNKIKQILNEWTVFEKLWLFIFTSVNIYLYFAWKDTLIGLVTSLTGMFCVVLVAKGKIANYWFGIINVILYVYISYNQKYYGEVMLNAFYFLPMQFIGWWLWSKNKMTGNRGSIKADFMTNKLRVVCGLISIIGVLIYGFILQKMGGNLPYVDSISTVFSVLAMILMARRYMEQWVLWIVVDVVSIVMWLKVFLVDGNDISMLVMWSAYLINAIYGFYNWIKLYNQQSKMGKDNLI